MTDQDYNDIARLFGYPNYDYLAIALAAKNGTTDGLNEFFLTSHNILQQLRELRKKLDGEK